MRQNTVRASEVTQGYMQLLLKDFPQDKWFSRPAGVPSHGAWQVGHLAASGNSGLKVMGQSSLVDDSWGELFGRGSQAVDDASVYPSVTELIETYNKVNVALTEFYAHADQAVLLADTTNQRLIERFPKQGDFIVFLLTSHLAVHAGQLSTLRKLYGLGNVM